MVCKKCKTEIPDKSNFCLSCGTKQAIVNKPRKPKTRGNCQGTAFKRGKTWTAKIQDGKKIDPKTGNLVPDVKTKGGFLTKKDALDYIPILRAGVPRQSKIRAATTLAGLWKNYSENAMLKISKGKQTHYRTAYKKLESIINHPISTLTIDDIQDVIDEKAGTYYPAKDMKTLLSHLYERAVAQGDAHSNLADFIELPELEEVEQRPFTKEDLIKIWKDYGDGHKISGYILLMAYSGMMPGELRKCEKGMIDWDTQQIVGCGLKTKKRKETPIAIADPVIPILRDLCDNSTTERIYTNFNERFYPAYHEALRRCGIEDRDAYACRHTTATALALGEIAPGVIKEIMRHVKFTTTQKYIHKDYNVTPLLTALNAIAKNSKTEERS